MVVKGMLPESTAGEAVERGTVISLFRYGTNGTGGISSKDMDNVDGV